MKYFLIIVIGIGILGCSFNTEEHFFNPNGIGVIQKLELKTINDSLMKVGLEQFTEKCAQCHTMEYANVGPDISDVLAVRKPEWVLNFLMNKEEMLQKDSLAKSTRLKYDFDCEAMISSKQEGLEILEYLRIYQIWLHEFNVK